MKCDRCTLASPNGNIFRRWPQLEEEIAHSVRAHSAILDREICCLEPGGTSKFNDLLFRREWPFFLAFDVLAIDGEDLRALPLIDRKRRLRRIMPRVEGRLRILEHVEGRGIDLFRAACERDVEGIVGKWGRGSYLAEGRTTSWVKIKNPGYSQMEGRHELFQQPLGRRKNARSNLVLALA